MTRRSFEGKAEKYKIVVIAILLGGSCFLTYYFHMVFNTGTVFTHFFYIPIILASLWWRRKGIFVALFLAAFLIFSHILLREDVATVNDYFRAGMFVVIAFAVATLRERVSRAELESEHALTERKLAEKASQESEGRYRHFCNDRDCDSDY